MSDTIRLQFSATADDVGTVQHKMLAFGALAESLLAFPPVKDHFATLRKSKQFARARTTGTEVAWCQQESSRFFHYRLSCDVPSLAKLWPRA